LAGGEGFEPPTSGSGGLCPIQARLPAHNTLSRHESEIINYGLWPRKEDYSIHTVRNDIKRLRRLDRRCSILEPEAPKRLIANSSWNSDGKQHICEVLDRFYRFLGIKWIRPRYQQVETLPWIPHTDEVDALINGLGNPLVGTFVHLINDTGAPSGEAWQLQWHQVGFETRTVTLTPEKGSLSRQVKASQALVSKLSKLSKDRKFVFHLDNVDPIKKLEYFTTNYQRGRRVAPRRLRNPRINLISFRALRHYKGSMEYYRTRDIIHVKQILGHKSINNTMRYVSLIPKR
jgi:integrase